MLFNVVLEIQALRVRSFLNCMHHIDCCAKEASVGIELMLKCSTSEGIHRKLIRNDLKTCTKVWVSDVLDSLLIFKSYMRGHPGSTFL